MTIEQTDKIDFLTITDAGEALLTISDHLPWDDQSSHLLLMQEKLNAYLRFIESGELATKYPQAIGRPIAIQIVAKFDPTEKGWGLIKNSREAIMRAGFELRVEMMRPN